MVLTGRTYSAKQGLEAGIVDEITIRKNLLPRAEELASSLAANGEYREAMKGVRVQMNRECIQVMHQTLKEYPKL